VHPIIRLRLQCGYTQAQLAALLDVSVATVDDWEHGMPPPPHLLQPLGQALRLDSRSLAVLTRAWMESPDRHAA